MRLLALWFAVLTFVCKLHYFFFLFESEVYVCSGETIKTGGLGLQLTEKYDKKNNAFVLVVDRVFSNSNFRGKLKPGINKFINSIKVLTVYCCFLLQAFLQFLKCMLLQFWYSYFLFWSVVDLVKNRKTNSRTLITKFENSYSESGFLHTLNLEFLHWICMPVIDGHDGIDKNLKFWFCFTKQNSQSFQSSSKTLLVEMSVTLGTLSVTRFLRLYNSFN